MAASKKTDRSEQSPTARPLRMGDLTRESGLSRQAIHFYIAEGLLPPPVSTGRNVAIYADEHLQRLHWIQKLQREQFLSLSAIKAVLNGGDVEAFSPQQKQLLRRVRDRLPGWAGPQARPEVRLADLLSEQLSEADMLELAEAGLIEIHGAGEDRTISQYDSDIVDCFIRYREAGATSERGYRPNHMASMDQAIERLVQQIAHLYATKWLDAPVEDAVAFVEAVIPIDERLMVVLFRKKIRELIEKTLEAASAS